MVTWEQVLEKGVTIPNKRKLIEIKKAWLDFYINKDKQTVIGIFISEFDIQEKATGSTRRVSSVRG